MDFYRRLMAVQHSSERAAYCFAEIEAIEEAMAAEDCDEEQAELEVNDLVIELDETLYELSQAVFFA